MDVFSIISYDVLVLLINDLNVDDVVSLLSTNKTMYELGKRNEDKLWRFMLTRDYKNCEVINGDTSKETYIEAHTEYIQYLWVCDDDPNSYYWACENWTCKKCGRCWCCYHYPYNYCFLCGGKRS